MDAYASRRRRNDNENTRSNSYWKCGHYRLIPLQLEGDSDHGKDLMSVNLDRSTSIGSNFPDGQGISGYLDDDIFELHVEDMISKCSFSQDDCLNHTSSMQSRSKREHNFMQRKEYNFKIGLIMIKELRKTEKSRPALEAPPYRAG